VGRRVAGTKFYRMIYLIVAALAAGAAIAHMLAGNREIAALDLAAVTFIGIALFLLKWPKRPSFFIAVAASTLLLAAATWMGAYSLNAGTAGNFVVAFSGAALLGSVMLAMLLGHWYLVVRGMPIDPLSRLTSAFLAASVVRLVVVVVAMMLLAREGFARETPLWNLAVREGIFFWMRIGWGVIAPLALYPMVRGTVRLRSTMAATGILYVAVVAVFIGEVLAIWLTVTTRTPL
jgi:hypothetical protein